MEKMINMLNEKNYYYEIDNGRIEIPFIENDCSIITVNNQYKVYTFEKNTCNIISESKWYKRPIYVVKYIINNMK